MPSIGGVSWEEDPLVTNVLGWVAVALTVGFILSSFKDLFGKHGVYGQKSTATLATGLPYFSGVFCFLLWLIYFAIRIEFLLQPIVINAFGLTMFSSYAICYCYFGRARSDIKYIVGGVIVVALTMGVYAATDDPEIIGYIAAGLNIMLYGSPLAALGEVRRTNSVEKMPLLPVIMALIVGSSWVAYTVYIIQIQAFIPNAAGVLLSSVQLVVYRRYSRVAHVVDAETDVGDVESYVGDVEIDIVDPEQQSKDQVEPDGAESDLCVSDNPDHTEAAAEV